MKIKKQLFLLAISLLMFLFSPSPIKAIDPGCSAQTPVCLGTTVVDQYRCYAPVNGSCDGTYDAGNLSISCGNNCSFQACSSNDSIT